MQKTFLPFLLGLLLVGVGCGNRPDGAPTPSTPSPTSTIARAVELKETDQLCTASACSHEYDLFVDGTLQRQLSSWLPLQLSPNHDYIALDEYHDGRNYLHGLVLYSVAKNDFQLVVPLPETQKMRSIFWSANNVITYRADFADGRKIEKKFLLE